MGTHSIRTDKLESRQFFSSYFKGPSLQDQQKTIKRRLITSSMTLTGQSHFMLFLYGADVTTLSHG